jgi:hypothetical protein
VSLQIPLVHFDRHEQDIGEGGTGEKAYKKVPGSCLSRAMASANKRSCHRIISFAMFPVTVQSPNTPRMQDCLLLSGSLLSRLYMGPSGFVNRLYCTGYLSVVC